VKYSKAEREYKARIARESITRKLVRDSIRFNAPQPGQLFELCEPGEMKELLIQKLEEEVKELISALRTLRKEFDPPAPDKLAVTQEAVDTYEVLRKIVRDFGLGSERHLLSNADDKRRWNGGFDAGVVLVTNKTAQARVKRLEVRR
jgi:predicted house-cleaning noncanonical NTP pyrophosphatase (MazG superfamily)